MSNEPEQSLEQAIWQTLTDAGIEQGKPELVAALIETFDKYSDAPRVDAPKRKREPDLIWEALARITKMMPAKDASGRVQWELLTQVELGQLRRYTKQLKQVKATPQQIDAFARHWYAHDWRGQKGQAPKPADVVKDWTRALTKVGAAGENVGAVWQEYLNGGVE